MTTPTHDDPPTTGDAARELLIYTLDASIPEHLAAARALARTLTLDQLSRIDRALGDARTIVQTVRARAVTEAIWEG